MPRKRRTMSGEDAQSIKSVPGQRYGEGVDQQALQKAMPAPDMTGLPTGGGGPATFSGASQAQPPMPIDPMQVQQFLGTTRPNLLSGTQLPDQPVTAGLPMGPGPGPEVLRRETAPIKRWLNQMSADSGNPKWRQLAEKAGL